MRTIREYEPEDIDLKDPIHGFLMAALLVNVLTVTSRKVEDDPDTIIKKAIASFLSMASKSGIVISKEQVPAVFTEAYK